MKRLTAVLVLVSLWLCPREVRAYGVLTHEAIVDAAWDESIVPILRARFHPSAEALRKARAFAYGGSMIQDIGYYPLAGVLFGQLTHYVRSGDFVEALIRESRTLDEEAFALGALSHYAADTVGHPLAVNVAAPLIYPKLRARYGNRMTYEDDPTAHLRSEFGFDVVQIARGAYLPPAYHDFIGFEVSKPVIERALFATYGLRLEDAFPSVDLAIGTFRRTVSTIIPEMTKVAWATKHDQIAERFPDAAPERFVFTMPRGEYERRWGRVYDRPNVGQRILAWLFRIIPKFGWSRSLAFKPPTPEAERLFLRSFERTNERYRGWLADAARHRLSLPDLNFDTGRPVRAGDYRLVDDAYAHWVRELEHRHFASANRAIQTNILSFYANPAAPIATKAHEDEWRRLERDLLDLRARR